MRGLNWQTLNLSLAGGLMQKADDRARQPPYLDIAKDVQFDEIGGLQTRYPYANLLGSGSLADARRIVPNGDELLVFTKDALYAYHEDQDTFVSKATHLAIKPTETPRYVTTGDQYDCDRASLSGMVVHTWTEGSSIYVAVSDETTGTVVLAPTAITGTRSRVVALSTKILLVWVDGSSNLVCGAIDPASDPADIPSDLSAPTTLLAAASFDTIYDVTRLLTTDTAVFAARRAVTTSYTLGTVTAGLSVSTSTVARTCDGPIAVASHPAGTQVQVIRTQTPSIEGDYITISGFADVYTGQAIGAATNTVEAVAAAFRSTTNGGQYRCYVFWAGDTGLTQDAIQYNYVDTANSIGTAATLGRRLALASRAFDHDGRVFVNTVFFEASSFSGGQYAQLQNTYFLYRDDALLCGKHLAARAGIADAYSSQALLPGVQNTATNTYTWCGIERRIVPLTNSQFAYTDRGPCDIAIEFDSNEARRVAKLGRTLYISGAEIMQYDGIRLTEVGFHLYPWSFAGSETAGGSIATNGTYAAKMTWRYDNGQGERERSTTATVGEVTIAAQPAGITYTAIRPLVPTHKTTPAIAAEVWRTQVNPTADSPFYLVTSTDPADASNPNRYISNDPTASALSTFNDELADASIADLEAHYENGGILENLAPPAASIIIANDTRLFLAGVAGDPDRVWYSKIRAEGEVAAFNDVLTVDVPRGQAGDITGLAILNDTLVVFRERAIYLLPGTGYGNFGDLDGSQNYGPARLVSTDCGAVNHESIATTDKGLVFKSSKGWYLLNRGWSLEYIGAPVTDYDSETPLAVNVVESQHQIRILTASRMLVFDTLANQWGEWTITDGVHAAMWRGVHTYLTSTQVKDQQSSYSSLTYGMDVETSWIKPADLQGMIRLRRLLVAGEYRSAHDLRIRVAYDYSSSYTDDKTWTVSPTTVGGLEQVKFGPSRQQCQAFKVRLTAQAVGTTSAPTGEALKLTGIAAEVGIKQGVYTRLPAAQRR